MKTITKEDVKALFKEQKLSLPDAQKLLSKDEEDEEYEDILLVKELRNLISAYKEAGKESKEAARALQKALSEISINTSIDVAPIVKAINEGIKSLKEMPEKEPMPVERKYCEWDFNVQRDKEGLIKSMRAKPVEIA